MHAFTHPSNALDGRVLVLYFHHASSPLCATRRKVALAVNEAARLSVVQQGFLIRPAFIS